MRGQTVVGKLMTATVVDILWAPDWVARVNGQLLMWGRKPVILVPGHSHGLGTIAIVDGGNHSHTDQGHGHSIYDSTFQSSLVV